MLAHHIHNAHHAIVVYHSHFGLNAIVATSIDGDVVVGLRHAVAYHMCHHIVKGLAGRVQLARVGRLLLVALYLFFQCHNFHFKCGIAQLQLLVDALEAKIGGDRAVELKHLCTHSVGRSEPHALLIGVVPK